MVGSYKVFGVIKPELRIDEDNKEEIIAEYNTAEKARMFADRINRSLDNNKHGKYYDYAYYVYTEE